MTTERCKVYIPFKKRLEIELSMTALVSDDRHRHIACTTENPPRISYSVPHSLHLRPPIQYTAGVIAIIVFSAH